MLPCYQDKHVTIYRADARDAADEIPDVGMLLPEVRQTEPALTPPLL